MADTTSQSDLVILIDNKLPRRNQLSLVLASGGGFAVKSYHKASEVLAAPPACGLVLVARRLFSEHLTGLAVPVVMFDDKVLDIPSGVVHGLSLSEIPYPAIPERIRPFFCRHRS